MGGHPTTPAAHKNLKGRPRRPSYDELTADVAEWIGGTDWSACGLRLR